MKHVVCLQNESQQHRHSNNVRNITVHWRRSI